MTDNNLELLDRRVGGGRGWVRSATFPRQVQSAPVARRFVTEAIAGHPGEEDAVLLADELVTNSLLHAHDATCVTVTVTVTGARIRVDVHDNGQTGIPHWRDASIQTEEGRGFQLVNALAHRWGFIREQGRTCCWFEVAATTAA